MEFIDWVRGHLWESWLAMAILFGVAEMFSLDLILLMLAGGAVVGMIAALVGLPVGAQMILAAGASIAALALVRPSMIKRLHTGPELTLGHAKLVGRQGVVTETISGLNSGRVKLGGEIWSAEPYDESLTLLPGQVVEVLEIRGATAFVHPVHSLEG